MPKAEDARTSLRSSAKDRAFLSSSKRQCAINSTNRARTSMTPWNHNSLSHVSASWSAEGSKLSHKASLRALWWVSLLLREPLPTTLTVSTCLCRRLQPRPQNTAARTSPHLVHNMHLQWPTRPFSDQKWAQIPPINLISRPLSQLITRAELSILSQPGLLPTMTFPTTI